MMRQQIHYARRGVVNLFGAITFGRMPQFAFDGFFPPGID